MKKLILLGALLISSISMTEEIERIIYQDNKVYQVKCQILEKKEIPFQEVKQGYINKIDKELTQMINSDCDFVVKLLRIYQLVHMKEMVVKLDYPSESIQLLIEENLR
ncbi:hypothetical protein [uncultured Fusobacterium sp.]|uniref:hypothetical protein n=1 Tax=uncultured Fusobacterium sp. TaxID=159267 RepID=UPI0015A551AC|nr:hypothetical protein [uncultured Fusobacterium sp.]